MAEADAFSFEGAGTATARARIGDRLRRARERAGLTRRDIAEQTKINERHLAALEASDFAALPGRIYAVGFARSYAGAVGLDGPAIAAEVRRELDERDRPANLPAHRLDLDDPAKVPSRRLAWVAGALALAVLASSAVLWRSYLVPAVELPPVRSEAALAAAVPALSPAPPTPAGSKAAPAPDPD